MSKVLITLASLIRSPPSTGHLSQALPVSRSDSTCHVYWKCKLRTFQLFHYTHCQRNVDKRLKIQAHSTLPYLALPNSVTSLYRAPFWRCCHGKHGAHVHRKAYARSRARGLMYMHNVHVCMYACTCMRFTLHSELWAYPSCRHPPRRRCPEKGGLSVHLN